MSLIFAITLIFIVIIREADKNVDKIEIHVSPVPFSR